MEHSKGSRGGFLGHASPSVTQLFQELGGERALSRIRQGFQEAHQLLQASRKALDIEALGEKGAMDLIDNGILVDESELFELTAEKLLASDVYAAIGPT